MYSPGPDGKKEKILAIATDLFSRKTFHEVSMDCIAKKARVAKGTLYYHFNSKEELYASLLQGGLDSLLERLNVGFTSVTTEEKLKTVIQELISFFHENREFFIVLQQEEAKLLTRKMKNCYEKICTVKDLLVAIIREGFAAGIFRETGQPDLIAEMIFGMIKGPVVRGKHDRNRHAQAVAEILFNGLKGGRHG